MNLVQLSPDGVIPIQPEHSGRTLCGDARGSGRPHHGLGRQDVPMVHEGDVHT